MIQVDTVDVQVTIFDDIETCIDAACFLAEYLFSPYTIQFSIFPLSFIQIPSLFKVPCIATSALYTLHSSLSYKMLSRTVKGRADG